MWGRVGLTAVRMLCLCVVLLCAGIVGYVVLQSLPALSSYGAALFDPETRWLPVSEPAQFGLVPAILGTVYVSVLSVAFALVLGLICAVFLEFYLPRSLAAVALSFIEMLSGVPSVLFGFLGLVLLVPPFARLFHLAAGQCVLLASVVLACMLLPYVVTSCRESLSQACTVYEKPALALGFDREHTIFCLLVPACKTGILGSAFMALGRAMGETMAVMMVIGNSPIIPGLLTRAQTLPALSALEMGSITYGSMHLSALYTANLVLLCLLALVLLAAYLLRRRARAGGHHGQ